MTKSLPCIDRRRFLLFAGASTVSLGSLGLTPPAGASSKTLVAQLSGYPRKEIARWSDLSVEEPVNFHYPFEEPHCSSMIVRLGREAWAGIGPKKDLVAFNQLCTHQGGLLEGQFQPGHGVLGPCPLHLTTFDLSRGGMVVSGHATQGLPQVILSIEGDRIFAEGLIGLVYGYSDNTIGIVKEGNHES